MYTVTTTTLPKYTCLFDDALTPMQCEILIDAFEASDKQDEWNRNGAPQFTQVNMNKDRPDLRHTLTKATLSVVSKYMDRVTTTDYMPLPQALEEFRVKRYNSGSDDRYDTHVDVESPESASRYLALLFYLNDDYTGGQTQFAEGPTIQPKRGTVLVFPPYWMYPHAGLRVLTGTKYIMSTYLHLR